MRRLSVVRYYLNTTRRNIPRLMRLNEPNVTLMVNNRRHMSIFNRPKNMIRSLMKARPLIEMSKRYKNIQIEPVIQQSWSIFKCITKLSFCLVDNITLFKYFRSSVNFFFSECRGLTDMFIACIMTSVMSYLWLGYLTNLYSYISKKYRKLNQKKI